MVTTAMENELVYNKKLSSVVPARITGAEKIIHDLKNMDLAMKLHYITGVYFFDKDAAKGLKIEDLKKPMFNCLELYYPVAGRIRTVDDDDVGDGDGCSRRRRPFIKCNDSGVRVVEAKCSKTLGEWISSSAHSSGGSFDQLVNDHVLGPDLGFSPLQIMKPFEAISAVIWKSLAKIRSESEPKIVTVCRNDSSSRDRSSLSLCNSQVISTVEAGNHLKVSEADLVELANLIAGKQVDERSLIEGIIMESDHKSSDFIIYGAKLTFVDLEDAKIYDLELNGHKPLFANYSLNGVGEEGAVVVLPGSSDYDDGERIVNLIIPENLIDDLKNELRKEWSIC